MPKRSNCADYNHDNIVLAGLSDKKRATIHNTTNASGDCKVVNTSHLLVSERLVLQNGQEFEWRFYHPRKLVQYVLENCPALARRYLSQLGRGSHVLDIVMGCDEYTPGSRVTAKNDRKAMNLVFNFQNLGHDILENDATWFIPCIVRHVYFDKVVCGGWSAMLRKLMEYFLEFEAQDIIFQIDNEVVMFKARLSQCMTDGEGFMHVLQWNGHASLRPDWMHWNVFSIASRMCDDERLGYVDITCSCADNLKEWNPDAWVRNLNSVLTARQQLANGEINNARLQEVIKASGFKITADGLLGNMLSDNFRKQQLEVWSYDWMHCTLQDGWLSTAMYLVVHHVTRLIHNSNYDSLLHFLRSCQFPMSKSPQGRSLVKVFDPVMIRKHHSRGCIVANASIQFTLYPLLKAWVQGQLIALPALEHPELYEHFVVYEEACRVVDLVKRIKYRRITTVNAQPLLQSAYSRYQELHKSLYGTDYFVPKSVWFHGFIKRIAAHSWLFDMFYVERLHQRVKPSAELHRNTTKFEEGVLTRVLDDQMNRLSSSSKLTLPDGELIGKNVPVTIAGFAFRMADKCTSHGMTVSCDDIVANGAQLGVVRACLLGADNALSVKVELLRHMRDDIWKHEHLTAIWPVDDLQHAVAWRLCGDNLLCVIR